MTISIVPPQGGSVFIGPGIPLRLTTSASPTVGNANWGISLYTGAITGSRVVQAQIGFPYESNGIVFIPYIQPLSQMVSGFQVAPTDTSGSIDVRLFTNSGFTIDSGSVNGQWDAQTGIGVQIQTMTQQESQGLPADQLALLQQSADGTASIIDAIATTVQSGVSGVMQTIGQIFSWQDTTQLAVTSFGAVTCDPIDVNLSGNACYGVELILTTIPDYIAFTGPAEDWTIQDLAVISITRDSQQIYRHGVHTKFFEIYPLPGISYPPALILNQIPFINSDYHIQVAFASGVCGQLVGRFVP